MTAEDYDQAFMAVQLRNFLKYKGHRPNPNEYDSKDLMIQKAMRLNFPESECNVWLANNPYVKPKPKSKGTGKKRKGKPKVKRKAKAKIDTDEDNDDVGDNNDGDGNNGDDMDDNGNIESGGHADSGNNSDDGSDVDLAMNSDIDNDEDGGNLYFGSYEFDILSNQGVGEREGEGGEVNATASTNIQQQADITSPPKQPLPENLKAAITDAVKKCEEREQDLTANGFPEGRLEFYHDPIRRELRILQQEAIAINIKEYMFFRYGKITDEEGNDLPGTLF